MLIPDLAWAIKAIVADGDTIVVRSEASGTPAASALPQASSRLARSDPMVIS